MIMSDVLLKRLHQAIYKYYPPKGTKNNYSPKRQDLKKYKVNLVIYNAETNTFEGY